MNKIEKQQVLSKCAKLFAADKKCNQEIFKGIMYSGNSNAYVSDTHHLLRVKEVSPFNEPHLLNAFTGTEIEGTYPADHTLDSMFNTDSIASMVLDDIPKVLSYVKILCQALKEFKLPYIVAEINGGYAYLTLKELDMDLKIILGNLDKPVKDMTIAFNPLFLQHSLEVFKTAKCLAVLEFTGPLSVIRLSNPEEGIDTLFLPIRMR